VSELTRWDVVIVGGANTDYLVRGKTLPSPGETIEGDFFQNAVGGKGANQAVAAARLGARVAFVGRVGNDDRGDSVIEELEKAGVDTTFMSRTDQKPTGVALVMVNENGEKQILTAPGANQDMRVDDVLRAAGAIRSAAVAVAQLEIPLNVVAAALEIADENRVRTVLDPAPAQPLDLALLRHVQIIRPNSAEARALTGIQSRSRSGARQAAQTLLAKGVRAAVVQAGAKGNLVVWPDGERWLPHIPVQTVDATGAGDAFVGALAMRMSGGSDLVAAAIFANAAAALATTKLGAQASLPTYEEVEDLLKRTNAA
jgi:ribokinase